MNWKKILGWSVVACVLVAVICNNVRQNRTDDWRVYGFFALTGKIASPGTEMSRGMELAIEKWNSKGGLLGKKISYVAEDTKGDPTEAITIYQRAIAGTDNKPIAIQAIVSGVASNVKNFTEKEAIPLIGAVGSSKFLEEPNNYVIRDFASPNIIGKGFTEYIQKYYSNKRIVYFYENSDMSIETKKAFLNALPKDVNIYLVDFDPSTTHFREMILKANVSNEKDIVVITGSGSYLGLLVRQLRQYDYVNTIVSDTNMMTSGIKEYAEQAMKNVIVLDFMPNPENPYCQEISKAYQTKYGKEIPFNAPYLSYQGIDTLLAFYEKMGTTDIPNLAKAMEGFEHEGCLGKGIVKNGELSYPLSFKIVTE